MRYTSGNLSCTYFANQSETDTIFCDLMRLGLPNMGETTGGGLFYKPNKLTLYRNLLQEPSAHDDTDQLLRILRHSIQTGQTFHWHSV